MGSSGRASIPKKITGQESELAMELYEVFVRNKRGLDHYHVGSVQAGTAEQALRNARDCYIRRAEGVSIWVVKSCDITASQESDSNCFYDPMADKIYRKAEECQLPKQVKNM